MDSNIHLMFIKNSTTTDIRFFSHLKSDTTAPVNSATELRYATTYKVKNQQEYTLLTWGQIT